MGLSEAKRRTRLVGSAVTNNSAWTNDASLPGQRMLSSMGWTQGQGLGTSSQGTAVPITMAFKMDNKGIGARRFEKEARASGKADAWIGGAGQLGVLFERLNKASTLGRDSEKGSIVSNDDDGKGEDVESSSKKIRSGKKERKVKKERKGKGKEKEKEEDNAAEQARLEEAVEKVASTLPNRMAHRARFLKAKRMVGTDLASVNEILGIASSAGTSSSAPVDDSLKSIPESTTGARVGQPVEPEIKEDKKHKKHKRKREDEDSTIGDEKRARKEAKRQAKEVKKEAKEKKKNKEQSESSTPSEETPDTKVEASSDPSFAAGGGMKVSTMSVHEYLQNKLIKRRAAIVRRKREEDASLWNRVATACN